MQQSDRRQLAALHASGGHEDGLSGDIHGTVTAPWHRCTSHPAPSSLWQGFWDRLLQLQKGLAERGPPASAASLLDPASTRYTTPYLEAKNGNGDT